MLSRQQKTRLKALILIPSFFIIFLFALNTVVILLSTPGNVQQGETGEDFKVMGNVKIVVFDEVESGGLSILGWNVKSPGYVNMLSSEPIIYISQKDSESIAHDSYLYKHELAHILQKEMIAHKSGGYPSVSNPWQSFKYYYYLITLNNDLKEIMPETNDPNVWFLTEGFESSAECFAQPESSLQDNVPTYYDAPYLKDGYCNAEQKKLAMSLEKPDEWLRPLTEEEKENLEPVNITTDSEESIDYVYLQKIAENMESMDKDAPV